MKIIKQKINLYGNYCEAELMEFDNSDKTKWKKLWDAWKHLKDMATQYQFRAPNLLEGISETAFCLFKPSSKRLINVHGGCNASADTYDVEIQRAEQIKATSIEEDLTSFGPDTRWDDLYFLDFYREGSLDGSFDVYLIDSELIYSQVLNKSRNETFRDQQKQRRRPRLSIKRDLIRKYNIEPIALNVRVWE